MSKVLLLGGTGAMGVYLGEILASDGYDVVITSRRTRVNVGRIRYRTGNAKEIDFLKNVLVEEMPDAIVDFMIYGTEEFSERRDLLLSKTRHYVFLSSYRVFNDDDVITERTPRLLDSSVDAAYLKTDEYALCKARSENLLREASSSNWTIIRPGITYSKTRFQLGCLEANALCFRALHGLPVIMPREMRTRETTMTWGRDVALMISRLILNPNAFAEDFNCTTAEHHSWQQVCDLYQELIGARVENCSLDEYIWAIGSRAQVCYDRMFNRVLDNSKILSVTGLRQGDLMTLREGLSRELLNFQKQSIRLSPNIVLNARLDRVLGTRMSLGGLGWRDRLRYCSIRYRNFGRIVQTVHNIKHRIGL